MRNATYYEREVINIAIGLEEKEEIIMTQSMRQ